MWVEQVECHLFIAALTSSDSLRVLTRKVVRCFQVQPVVQLKPLQWPIHRGEERRGGEGKGGNRKGREGKEMEDHEVSSMRKRGRPTGCCNGHVRTLLHLPMAW